MGFALLNPSYALIAACVPLSQLSMIGSVTPAAGVLTAMGQRLNRDRMRMSRPDIMGG
jgi:hypothetical protein